MNVSELLFINIDLELKKELGRWPGREKLFMVESCARDVLVGHISDFGTLPEVLIEIGEERAKREFSPLADFICTGERAYETLLAVVCGLYSDKVASIKTRNEAGRRWEEYLKNSPAEANRLSEIVHNIFRDHSLIKAGILNNLVSPNSNFPAVARRAANIKNNQHSTVLIVADEGDLAISTAIAIGKHVGRLIVTHSDDNTLRTIVERLQPHKNDKRIDANISSIQQDSLGGLDFNSVNHVMVCTPMLANQDFDRRLIELWNARTLNDGHMIHLRGSVNNDEDIQKEWEAAKHLISPLTIKQRRGVEIQSNVQMLESAITACKNCAFSRARNQGPVKKSIHLPHDEYRVIALKNKWTFSLPVMDQQVELGRK